MYGESITLKNTNAKDFNKYEPVLFQNRREASEAGYLVDTDKYVRDLTESSKSGYSLLQTTGKVINSAVSILWMQPPCSNMSAQEDELRLLAKDGNNKLDAICVKLRNGVNLNGRGNPDAICSYWQGIYDRTPIMIAAQCAQVKAVGYFMDRGANFNLLDYEKNTTLDLAIKKANATDNDQLKESLREIIDLLKQAGATQNETSAQQLTTAMTPINTIVAYGTP